MKKKNSIFMTTYLKDQTDDLESDLAPKNLFSSFDDVYSKKNHRSPNGSFYET